MQCLELYIYIKMCFQPVTCNNYLRCKIYSNNILLNTYLFIVIVLLFSNYLLHFILLITINIYLIRFNNPILRLILK